ncbi:MAG: hypothetical protein M1828_000462 [Chrysothrix sp. TS-e1954]|nr:MAG: hypothetical protein M1828_000462 [Chrysothrix sp. TS-e1954]
MVPGIIYSDWKRWDFEDLCFCCGEYSPIPQVICSDHHADMDAQASHAEEYNASHPIPCTIGVSTTGANIETLYDDVLIPILDHVLVHYMPIPIDPLFRQVKSTNPYKERDPERHKRSTIDTSVLRASPRCLGIGYERYYALNTFVMDLSYFDKLRDTLSIWPDFPFISTALSQVKTLVLHGGPANNWKNAKKVLVEFQNLEVLILDTRSYCDNPYYDWARINYESAKDVKSEFPGVMNPLWHHETWAQVRTRQAKAKKTKDGGSTRRKIFHQSRGTWVVQPCAGKIKTMLLGAGVKVKDDCIMMADQNRLSTDSYHFTVDRLAYSIEEGIKRDKEIEEEKLYGKKVWKKPKIVKPDWHERAMARS